MNRAHISADVKLDLGLCHKWLSERDGHPVASVDLGGVDIHFTDATEARAIAAACIGAAEYIEQQSAAAVPGLAEHTEAACDTITRAAR